MSSAGLHARLDAARNQPSGPRSKTMSFLTRTTASLAIAAGGAWFAAALYSESHRAPDQP
jgi:hypothetical protein